MNKAELIEEVANKVGITKKEVGNIIDATVETITNTLSKEEKVTLVGFGTFQVLNWKDKKRSKSTDRGGTYNPG